MRDYCSNLSGKRVDELWGYLLMTGSVSVSASRRCEMQDRRAGNADADREDRPTPPVRKNAEGNDRETRQ